MTWVRGGVFFRLFNKKKYIKHSILRMFNAQSFTRRACRLHLPLHRYIRRLHSVHSRLIVPFSLVAPQPVGTMGVELVVSPQQEPYNTRVILEGASINDPVTIVDYHTFPDHWERDLCRALGVHPSHNFHMTGLGGVLPIAYAQVMWLVMVGDDSDEDMKVIQEPSDAVAMPPGERYCTLWLK